MKLIPTPIPEWRQMLHFRSVQVAGVLTFLSLMQADVLPLLQPVIPPHLFPLVSAGLGLTVIVVRGLVQAGLAAKAAAQPAAPVDDVTGDGL